MTWMVLDPMVRVAERWVDEGFGCVWMLRVVLVDPEEGVTCSHAGIPETDQLQSAVKETC